MFTCMVSWAHDRNHFANNGLCLRFCFLSFRSNVEMEIAFALEFSYFVFSFTYHASVLVHSVTKYQFQWNLSIFFFWGNSGYIFLHRPATISMRQQKHCNAIKAERLIGTQATIFLLLNDFNGKLIFNGLVFFFFLAIAALPPLLRVEKIETITANNNKGADWRFKPKCYSIKMLRTIEVAQSGGQCNRRWNTSSLFVPATTKWLIVWFKSYNFVFRQEIFILWNFYVNRFCESNFD